MTRSEAQSFARALRRMGHKTARIVRHSPRDPEWFVWWIEDGYRVMRVFWARDRDAWFKSPQEHASQRIVGLGRPEDRQRC